ncbi:unnamed protein product [Polarella glacialis]|uniref:Uncharacterized protein n=1 Tax=Polarella glacialis TaxID=89957 RepID=A0A813LHB1_POLGL|nr:unnamed protein product [Polarella glacialis]
MQLMLLLLVVVVVAVAVAVVVVVVAVAAVVLLGVVVVVFVSWRCHCWTCFAFVYLLSCVILELVILSGLPIDKYSSGTSRDGLSPDDVLTRAKDFRVNLAVSVSCLC